MILSAIAQSNTKPIMQSEPKKKPENGHSTTDVVFDLDDKELTVYIRPDKRMSIGVDTMGLPQDYVEMMKTDGFWESNMGQMIEHQIISHMSTDNYLYVGYKNGYFVGFDCIPIINWLNKAINDRQGDTKRLITKVVISEDMKPHIAIAVRGLGKHMKKPATTRKCEADGPEGSKVEIDVELCYECDLHYDDSGNLIRNVSTLEKKLLKTVLKKRADAEDDAIVEFMSKVREEVEMTKEGACHCCHSQPE